MLEAQVRRSKEFIQEHAIVFCVGLFSMLNSLWIRFLPYLRVSFCGGCNVERQGGVILKDNGTV